jgi:predicted O-methyltransferase YrrM
VQALAERSVTDLPPIAAMTTDAERECYYRLAKEAAGTGAIVELGAWMGASTAYIAAGIRDSGVEAKAHVYDKFESKPGHIGKVKAFYDKHGIDRIPVGPCLQTFRDNLGPLLEYVEPHPGQIEQMRWGKESISLLVTDAPKRVPAISAVLTTLRNALQPGALMAWQDFCHFPSYEIPACLYRLRDHLEFVEAVVPGTTLVFRVKSQWNLAEVTQSALALSRWTPEEIMRAWAYWAEVVAPEKTELFYCGETMFLCDIGEPALAVHRLGKIMARNDPSVVKKWRYLKEARPDFLTRYAPLFAYLEGQGAI